MAIPMIRDWAVKKSIHRDGKILGHKMSFLMLSAENRNLLICYRSGCMGTAPIFTNRWIALAVRKFSATDNDSCRTMRQAIGRTSVDIPRSFAADFVLFLL